MKCLTVELFLTHYDAKPLDAVLARLRSPEAEEGMQTRVKTVTEDYPRNSAHASVFKYLETLPTYSVQRLPKMGEVKRALCLAGMPVHEGTDKEADDMLRERFTTKLRAMRDDFAAKRGTKLIRLPRS